MKLGPTFFIISDKEISLHDVQLHIPVDISHIFNIKINPYLKINHTFEISIIFLLLRNLYILTI